jgi:hypothetical protein
MSKDDVIESIEDLAREIADLARGKDIPFMDRVEALKVLVGYQAMLTKGKPKNDDASEEAANFRAFRRKLSVVEDPPDEST